MKIGIPKEVFPGERRVATTPKTSRKLIEDLGFEVLFQSGAATDADFRDETYQKNGCQIVGSAAEIWQQADIVLKVRGPSDDDGCIIHRAILFQGVDNLSYLAHTLPNGDVNTNEIAPFLVDDGIQT